MQQSDLMQRLGMAMRLLAGGRFGEAKIVYQQILQQHPNCTDAMHFLGLALFQTGEIPSAIEWMSKSIRQAGNVASYHSNIGEVFRSANRLADAEAAFRKAISLDARNAKAHYNLAILLEAKNELKDAIQHYEKAIAIKPDYMRAQWNLSTALLRDGNYQRGFEKYEYRFRDPALGNRLPNVTAKLWDGSPLNGRTILLHHEQGFGDSFQFIRYASILAQSGQVIVAAPRDVAAILARVPGVSQVFAIGQPLPRCDVWSPMLSLGRLMRTTIQTIPWNGEYLVVDSERHAKWSAKLAALQGRKAGIVWAGRKEHLNDAKRSIPLGTFARITDAADWQFVSLQKGDRALELRSHPAGARIIDLSDQLEDFDDTAACIANLDLVITVDTSVAHLAGAMGKPVWILLPFCPDWRWLLDRSDSPWYPSAKLFRQNSANNWEPVIDQVIERLRTK